MKLIPEVTSSADFYLGDLFPLKPNQLKKKKNKTPTFFLAQNYSP